MTTEHRNTSQARGYVLPILVITLANLWGLWDTRQRLSEVQAVIIRIHEQSNANRKAIIQLAKTQKQDQEQKTIIDLQRRKTP